MQGAVVVNHQLHTNSVGAALHAQNFVPRQQRHAIRCTMSLSAKQTGKSLKSSLVIADTFAVDVPLQRTTVGAGPVCHATSVVRMLTLARMMAHLLILGPETRGAVVSIVGLATALPGRPPPVIMAFSLAFPCATSRLLTRVV